MSSQETELLTSSAAPIVLLAKHKVPNIADNIAPNLQEIGVMLPSNPLQHLLLRAVNRPLVMTSANASGQPPSTEKMDMLWNKLADLADFLFFVTIAIFYNALMIALFALPSMD